MADTTIDYNSRINPQGGVGNVPYGPALPTPAVTPPAPVIAPAKKDTTTTTTTDPTKIAPTTTSPLSGYQPTTTKLVGGQPGTYKGMDGNWYDNNQNLVPTPARTADQVYADYIKVLQPQLDAINSKFDAYVQQQIQANKGTEGSARAIAAASGTAGSPEAAKTTADAANLGSDALNKIAAERNAEIQGILGNLSTKAIDVAKQETDTARTQAQDYIAKRGQEAQSAIKSLAVGNYNLDDIKSKYPDDWNHLVAGFNGDENQLRSFYVQNKPQGKLLNGDKPTISADGHTATYFEQVMNADGTTAIKALPIHSEADLNVKNADIVKTTNGIFAIARDASGNVSAVQIGGPSGGGVNQFSKTQINKGAEIAGVPIDKFSTFDKDLQNFFVSSPTVKDASGASIPSAKDLIQNKIIAPINAGTDPQSIISMIDASNQPQSVKDYLKGLAEQASSTKPTSSGKSWWQKLLGQ